ncbi:MAG: hypothetical protein CMN03_02110 [Roseibacillus sp.]|nr:hypothetical protein [Roseibacillus sp.]
MSFKQGTHKGALLFPELCLNSFPDPPIKHLPSLVGRKTKSYIYHNAGTLAGCHHQIHGVIRGTPLARINP